MRTIFLAAIAAVATAAPVHVAGQLLNADGSQPTGFVILTWQTFTRNATLYKAGSITKTITAGALDLNIEPGYYSAAWGGSSGIESMTLYVPAGRTGTVPLTDCLLTDATRLSMTDLAAGGATTGQLIAWNGSTWAPITSTASGGPWPISLTTGLQAALDAGAAATAAETAARIAAVATIPPGPYSQTYTAVSTASMLASAHGLGAAAHPPASVTCWDSIASNLLIVPWSIDTSDNITIDLSDAAPFTGRCTLRP